MKKKQFLALLGKRVSDIRKTCGFSQFDVVDTSDKIDSPISINTISNVERGVKDIRVSTLLYLSESLNISLSDLMDFDKPISKIVRKK